VDIVRNGYRISNTRVNEAFNGKQTKRFRLKSGVDLSKAGCISLYCEQFNADMGHVTVKKKKSG